MKNLLKTSALAAVLALSANSANAANQTVGFKTQEDIDVTLNFVSDIEIHMTENLNLENLVAGDSFEVETEALLEHDSDRYTSCDIDDSVSHINIMGTQPSVGTAIGQLDNANAIAYDVTLTDSNTSNTLPVMAQIKDKDTCNAIIISATEAQTDDAYANGIYTAAITVSAAYDTVTDIDITLTTPVIASSGNGSANWYDADDDGTEDVGEKDFIDRELNFSTDSNGLDATVAYTNGTNNSTVYQTSDGSSADSTFSTEVNGFDLDSLTVNTDYLFTEKH